MITPKEKAKKLIKSFTANAHGQVGSETLFANSRKCALKLTDEVLKVIAEIDEKVIKRKEEIRLINEYAYWREVKDEILNKRPFNS